MGQGSSLSTSLNKNLEEHYFVQKVKLGQGSYGSVWRAVDRRRGRLAAIKQVEKVGRARAEQVEREVAMMQAVTHENIVKLYDTFEDAQYMFLALEYCDDGDFGDKVRERSENLPEWEAASFVRQALAAVATLHTRCVCHRDVKPDNFMIAGGILKLADFGLACFLPRGKTLVEKCGSPGYMAPEQHLLPRRSPGYGLAVDVWASGVLMFQVLCGGQHPFTTAVGVLDQSRLIQGAMSFPGEPSPGGRTAGFGLLRDAQGNFPEAPRQLCRQLVNPSPSHRVPALRALNHPWLMQEGALPRPPPLQAGMPAARPASQASMQAAQASLPPFPPPVSMRATLQPAPTPQAAPQEAAHACGMARRRPPPAPQPVESKAALPQGSGYGRNAAKRQVSGPWAEVVADEGGPRPVSEEESGTSADRRRNGDGPPSGFSLDDLMWEDAIDYIVTGAFCRRTTAPTCCTVVLRSPDTDVTHNDKSREGEDAEVVEVLARGSAGAGGERGERATLENAAESTRSLERYTRPTPGWPPTTQIPGARFRG